MPMYRHLLSTLAVGLLLTFGVLMGAAVAPTIACYARSEAKALWEAGVATALFVTGFGPEAGAPMLTHPDIRAISFTGSSEVGRMIGEVAAQSLLDPSRRIRSSSGRTWGKGFRWGR